MEDSRRSAHVYRDLLPVRRAPEVSAIPPTSVNAATDRPFKTYHAAFKDVLGPSPFLRLLATTENGYGGHGRPIFHEAGVFVPPESDGGGDVWITSNILMVEENEYALEIEIGILRLPPDAMAGTGSEGSTDLPVLEPAVSSRGVMVAQGADFTPLRHGPSEAVELLMPNGGTAWGRDILFCCQGQDRRRPGMHAVPFIPSALIAIDPRAPDHVRRVIVDNFHGRAFNSLNDVCVHRPSGCLFFTDPDYGYEQNFKVDPQLPNAVWRYDPADDSLGMVADGLKKPNGVVFSPDGGTCYITDTDFIHGDGDMDGSRAGTIYAYDVRTPPNGPPHLHSKRVFAFVDCGAPDGIKCDEAGNVYTGCFDGVHVFAPSGLLIGKILLPPDSQGRQRGCANLVFGPPGRLIILSERTVWEARIAAVGDLKGVEVS